MARSTFDSAVEGDGGEVVSVSNELCELYVERMCVRMCCGGLDVVSTCS